MVKPFHVLFQGGIEKGWIILDLSAHGCPIAWGSWQVVLPIRKCDSHMGMHTNSDWSFQVGRDAFRKRLHDSLNELCAGKCWKKADMWLWAENGQTNKGTPPVPPGFLCCYSSSLGSRCRLDV